MYTAFINADLQEAMRSCGYAFDGHDEINLNFFSKLTNDDLQTVVFQTKALLAATKLPNLGLVAFNDDPDASIGLEGIGIYADALMQDPDRSWNVFMVDDPKSPQTLADCKARINALVGLPTQDGGIIFVEPKDNADCSQPSTCNIIETTLCVIGCQQTPQQLLRSDLWKNYQNLNGLIS